VKALILQAYKGDRYVLNLLIRPVLNCHILALIFFGSSFEQQEK
jgi:hypothetical protein